MSLSDDNKRLLTAVDSRLRFYRDRRIAKPDATLAFTGPELDCLLAAVAEAAVKDAVGGEAVAWEFQHEDTGLTMYECPQQVEWGFEKNNPRWKKIGPVYRRPQASAAVPEGFVLVEAAALIRWRSAFSEELVAYDIEPPLHHVKTSHDEIDALLKSGGAG